MYTIYGEFSDFIHEAVKNGWSISISCYDFGYTSQLSHDLYDSEYNKFSNVRPMSKTLKEAIEDVVIFIRKARLMTDREKELMERLKKIESIAKVE